MSDPSSQPTQPLTEGEPYEDTFMVSHQQTALGEHELDKIRAYFKEQIRPGGDLSDPDGTMARIWMGRLLADAGLSRQMLARAEAEAERLRAEYASLSKVYKIINDAHEYKSIKVYELTDQLDALELKLKSNPVHFVRLGRGDAACGEGLPGIVPWDPARLDFSSPTLTTRREKTTCTECLAALGLDQDGRGQANG